MVDGNRIRQRLVELVQVPSLTGDEAEAIDLLHRWLVDLQSRASVEVEVDRWTDIMSALELDPAYPGREVDRAEVPVVAARISGSQPGRTVVLTGHVDVVPPGDLNQWSHDPFSAHVEDGDRLYGRGACDMKSGVIAALEVFEAVASGEPDFPGELVFVAVPGEEDGGTGTLSAIRRGWVGDCVIITEPTSGGSLAGDNAPPEGFVEQAQPDPDAQPAVVVAHAGALTFTLSVKGRSAHASKRLQGQSALEHFMSVHEAMRADEQAINEAEDHPYLRALGLPYPTNVGVIRGGEWSSSVMDHLEAEVRTGVALGETPEQAEFRFREAIADVGKENPWLEANPVHVERTGAVFGSAEIDVAHPLVRTLRRAAAREFGGAPRLAAAPYGCDMRLWVNEAGAATAVYGPGDIRLAHAPDEWVSLRETERVARVLLEACSRMMIAEEDT